MIYAPQSDFKIPLFSTDSSLSSLYPGAIGYRGASSIKPWRLPHLCEQVILLVSERCRSSIKKMTRNSSLVFIFSSSFQKKLWLCILCRGGTIRLLPNNFSSIGQFQKWTGSCYKAPTSFIIGSSWRNKRMNACPSVRWKMKMWAESPHSSLWLKLTVLQSQESMD